MNIIVITVDQPKHLNFLKKIYKNRKIKIKGLILIKNKTIIPKPPKNLSGELKKLWILHFRNRYESEKKFFGTDKSIKNKIKNKIFISNKIQLHSKKTLEFVKSLNIKACFIFGGHIIKDPLYKLLPDYKINLHLGLIPHYKGSVTMFWPLYHLKPNLAGSTYHIINRQVDCGEIIHQSVPDLEFGDNLHDVANKSIIKIIDDLDKVIDRIIYRVKKNIKIKFDKSLSKKGKTYRFKDWKPEMLTRIYKKYNDRIVDLYLKKK